MRIIAIALVLAAAASAQVTSPLLGWFPDGTQVRPMNGLPAAATLGPPANLGHALNHIAISPSQNYVLGSDSGTGQILVMVPGASATPLNLPINPDQIVNSPRGSSAAIWFSAAAEFDVVSGLPATPTIRQISASLTNTTAIAVSDDGQSIAAASSAGVFEWGTDSVWHQVYSGNDATALAFFAGTSELAIATSTQILAVVGSSTSVVNQGSFAPAGMATSFDNQKIVLADQSGTIYSVDAGTNAVSTVDCQCRPGGVFGLGGALFRLTSSSAGAIKVFDAGAGSILAIPGDILRTNRGVRRTRAQATAAAPTLTINLSPTPTGYLQQPAMTIAASSASSSEIDGTVTLTFASTSTTGGTDQTVQFSTSGSTVNFTIPAGSTQANFSGAPSVTFSSGTVAGTITLAAAVGGTTVATQTVTMRPTSPVITSVKLSPISGGVNVVVTGYSTSDDITSAVIVFALASNATITQNDIGVSLSPQFQPYYANSSSYATGSEFTVTIPFTVTGNVADMVGVSVSLLNSVAASRSVSSQ